MTRTEANVAYIGVWMLMTGAILFPKLYPPEQRRGVMILYLLCCGIGGVGGYLFIHWR